MVRADAHTVDVDEVHTDVAQDASPTATVGVMSLVWNASPLTVTKPPSVATVLQERHELTTGAARAHKEVGVTADMQTHTIYASIGLSLEWHTGSISNEML